MSEMTTMPMTEGCRMDLHRRGEVTEARFSGEICLDTAPWVEACLAELVGQRPATLVIDLEGVELLSAAGVTVLVRTVERCERAGVAIVVSRPRPIVRKVLDICGMALVIPVVG